MNAISANELDLLTFFECEPKLRDSDVPWIYNDALYEFSLGELSISCAIAPSCKDVRLILKNRAQIIYELNAMGVASIGYHNKSGQEALEIELVDQSKIWVRLKPVICINHNASK